MKILFQGGWKYGRDTVDSRSTIEEYCRSLAWHLAKSDHQLILSSPREFDEFIATEVERAVQATGRSVKDSLLFLLASRYQDIPTTGRVQRFEAPKWWLEERTYIVEKSDAVVAIGGGKGTVDCIQKALLAGKPVFVAGAIQGYTTEAWRKRAEDYHYLHHGDADFTDDLNVSADEFIGEVFRVLNSLAATRYSRRVFVVHGRDHHFRDTLVSILERLGFTPIVLQQTPGQGRTIIESIELEAARAGFAFVLYTPDDVGKGSGGAEAPRARQNVVFEHGVLIGSLGRERTCALVRGNIDLPSDVDGLIYESVGDIGEESIRIARILKHAGYKLDTSALL